MQERLEAVINLSQQQQAATDQRMQELTDHLKALTAQLSARVPTPTEAPPRRTPFTPFAATSSPPRDRPEARLKRKPLPLGDPFDGTRSMFPAWKMTMGFKLQTDSEFIGDNAAKWVFLYNQLTRSVQQLVATYYEKGGPEAAYDPAAFLEYLDGLYGDPHRQEVAQSQLERLQQAPSESFTAFLLRFEQKVALAGGMHWPDDWKLTRLRNALNADMKRYSVGRGISRTDFSSAVAMYRAIAVDIETYHLDTRRKGTSGGQPATNRDADGDLPMIGAHATGTGRNASRARTGRGPPSSRANWVPESVYQARRAAGVCLRCGDSDHYARACANAVRMSNLGAGSPPALAPPGKSQSPGEE